MTEIDRDKGAKQNSGDWFNSTILGAGLTSGLGDFNYETCNVILPGFLAVLGVPAAALGAIEGIADGISSFSKLGAGYIADKLGHRKTLVVVGYGLTALMPVFFALSGGWVLVLFGRIIGWLGKGIRGPLRDAIMAEAITPESKGKAFGFHRAADTAGAVIGPLLGVALLGWTQNLHPKEVSEPFRMVFWMALIPGILSVLSFAVLVRDDRSVPNPRLRFWSTLKGLPEKFKSYLRAVGLFGIGDFAHTLLILAATQLLTAEMGVIKAAMIAGFLYVWRNAVQAMVSFPVGALADRVGHRCSLVVGYAMGVCVAALTAGAFAFQTSNLVLWIVIFTLAVWRQIKLPVATV
jgi:MFS family permease